MKKILVITPFFYPHVGGSERYMENLYAYFVKKNPKVAVDVLCYNTENAKEEEKYKGMNVYRIPGFTILKDQFCLSNPVSLIKFLANHRDYDLVHPSTRFFDSTWWAVWYARLIKARLVLTDHCAYHPTTNNWLVNSIVRLFEKTIVKFSLNFYDQIFVQNKKTGEFLKKEFNKDSIISYPGLGKIYTQKTKKSNDKMANVVYVGRLIESKGIEILIDLAKEIKGANFIFAGDGELRKKLQSKKIKNVSFLGNLSEKEVSTLLNSADIFAYPSWHSEGLPMAILEAGERGIAVVATQTGGIPEVIKNNKTGLLVKPRDIKAFKEALNRLVESKKLRETLGKKLQEEVIKTFSWDKAANQILKQLH
jgi:L-malate glycosyltransferase